MGGLVLNEILWILAIVIFSILEATTQGLVSIWFAGGAVAALIAASLNADTMIQSSVFIVVSVILLIALRGIAKKNLKNKTEKTNADRIIGETVTVEKVSPIKKNEGTVKINDVEWKIVVQNSELSVGDILTVEKIEGVKLIARK